MFTTLRPKQSQRGWKNFKDGTGNQNPLNWISDAARFGANCEASDYASEECNTSN